MIPECLGIIIIILLLVIDFLRRGKRRYAISTLPLLILPVVHVTAVFLADRTPLAFNLDALHLTMIIADAAAALLTILFLFLRKKYILSGKNKLLYFFGCSGYTLIVATILILISII